MRWVLSELHAYCRTEAHSCETPFWFSMGNFGNCGFQIHFYYSMHTAGWIHGSQHWDYQQWVKKEKKEKKNILPQCRFRIVPPKHLSKNTFILSPIPVKLFINIHVFSTWFQQNLASLGMTTIGLRWCGRGMKKAQNESGLVICPREWAWPWLIATTPS